MRAMSMCGQLPLAAAVKPIQMTEAIARTPTALDAPPIHQYFNDGLFTDTPMLNASHGAIFLCLSLAFALPLAQSTYRMARFFSLTVPLRKLPGLAQLLPEPERQVEIALREMRTAQPSALYDHFNSATGWWLDTYGAWLSRLTLIMTLPLLTQDMLEARYRLLSCSLVIATIGVLTFLTFRNESRANQQYLGVSSPNISRLSLLLKSARQPNAIQDLQELNRRIRDTAPLRRQMLGIFNYRPTHNTPLQAPGPLKGKRIA